MIPHGAGARPEIESALDKSTINYRVDTETRLSCHEAIMLTTLARVEHFLNSKFNYLFFLRGRACLWVCVITFSEWSDSKQEAKGNGGPARTKAPVRKAERNLCWRLLRLYSNSSRGFVQVLQVLWFSIISHPTLKQETVATNTPRTVWTWTHRLKYFTVGKRRQWQWKSLSPTVVFESEINFAGLDCVHKVTRRQNQFLPAS